MHYEPVQLLYRPAVLHKVICQPIEQFRMRGRLSPGAEVAGRPNQAGAKMLHPKSIYKNARGQWIVFAGYCFGEIKPAAAFGKWFPFFAREDFKELLGHLLTFIDGVA